MEQAVLFALGALATHYLTQKKLEARDNIVAGFGPEQKIHKQAFMPVFPAVEPKLNRVTDASFLQLIDEDEVNALRFNAKFGKHQPGMDWSNFRAIQMPGQQMGIDFSSAVPK
jgi:hypothetical protein